jgi:hypothetical protein
MKLKDILTIIIFIYLFKNELGIFYSIKNLNIIKKICFKYFNNKYFLNINLKFFWNLVLFITIFFLKPKKKNTI